MCFGVKEKLILFVKWYIIGEKWLKIGFGYYNRVKNYIIY